MAKDYEDPRPISQQIAADLREQILSGDIVDVLPSFSQLAKTFNVAVNTCQNAVQILREEGLVSGRQGVRLSVHAPEVKVVTAGVYFDPKRDRVRYTPVETGWVDAPRNVAEQLGEGGAFLRKQLMSMDGEPVEVVRNYYPRSLASGTELESRKQIGGGAARVLAEMGLAPTWFADVVSERQPTREEMRLLQLPGYASILQTFRVTYSADERVVEVSVLAKGSHRLAVRYEVTVH